MTDPTPTSVRAPRTVAPGVCLLAVEGDVTPATGDDLTDAYARCDGAQAVVLDFTALDYMNSGGIGLLVTLVVRAQRKGQRLLAFGLSDHYRQIFQLTRLEDVIELHDHVDEAVGAATATSRP